MYTTLIDKIEETLEKVDKIAKIYAYPVSKIEGYPAVIFQPADFENSFSTSNENYKIYKFKMWVIVNGEKKSMKKIFATVLPNVVDDIIAQFDEDWDSGTIEGHRCWVKVDSGYWTTDSTQDSQTAYAELDLVIKVLTNN